MILKTYDLTGIKQLVCPEDNANLTLESPALDIFTDFKQTEPLVVEHTLDIVTAEDLMKKTHVKLKLVLDQGNFVGMLAYEDLIGEKALAHANHLRRSEILVSQIMTPRSSLEAIDYIDVKRAKIKDIVETLKNEGRQHFLVIDGKERYIRGIFSAADIARRLHVPININRVSTFMDIYRALDH
ncbi:MAG: CBS domain-containing protein [Tatlockia sp.]|nr:CBS domain-containing protein [Tatlockia sp.]